jgi:rod shape-determining protein MreC
MDSFLSRFQNSLVLLALVLAQTIALAVQVQRPENANDDSKRVTQLRYWVVATVTPFERVLHGSGLRVRSVWSNYIALRHTRAENLALQNEIARLRQEQAAFAEDARQGRRMEALLDFKQHYITATVAAQVIYTSGSDRTRVLYLDKGSQDGLKPDQAVMTPDGVVGKLRDVFPHTAQLLLLSDPTSGAGVILESSRIRGIVRGSSSGKVQIVNLTADSRINPGERVITSGGDRVFPRGLPVGVIEKIQPDPDHQPFTLITLKPAADLTRLEEVLVITGTSSQLTPAAQADVTLAETTAAETRRAAQEAAERLPSAKEDVPAGTDAAVTPAAAPGVPGIPNSGVPKPTPALHADRYTPGVTPRADQLTPGAPHGNDPPAQPPPPKAEVAPEPAPPKPEAE